MVAYFVKPFCEIFLYITRKLCEIFDKIQDADKISLVYLQWRFIHTPLQIHREIMSESR